MKRMCVTDHHDMTLAVNTTDKFFLSFFFLFLFCLPEKIVTKRDFRTGRNFSFGHIFLHGSFKLRDEFISYDKMDIDVTQ